MKTGLAKIPVQNSFCASCSHQIRKELLKIEDISNVHLFPTESLVVFNFVRANELSTALNVLTDLGYPQVGDRINGRNHHPPYCTCTRMKQKNTYLYNRTTV
ncbi:heavy-metal-associated domain-containing protein [Flagellimonas eckloniae]|uniref:heavy-metal-associated domain-containing protein n=1 Tax=Flagellimonas eckloniae TaxID=346185 RepID=UPI0011125287|nr:heavy-metal-associated domain-containing protein [Allomuricauda eckloniae]